MNRGFSHGNGPVQTINSTAANERLGLGTTLGTASLTAIRNFMCPVTPYSNGKCVNIDGNAGAGIPIGAVDWNRDGVYEPSATVQGLIALAGVASAAFSIFPSNTNLLADASMSWVNVGGAIGNQLWMVGRNGSGQLAWARTSKANLDAACGSFASYEEGQLDCAGLGGITTTVPGPVAVSVSPGLAEYNDKLLIVYQKTTGTICSKVVTIDSSTGSVSYGAEVTLPVIAAA